MLVCKYYTKKYKQEHFFNFQGKDYYVHSIVRLTKEGQQYLGSKTREVVLVEQFINWNGKTCWKYQFRGDNITDGIVDYATDRTPNELIEKVIVKSTAGYTSREKFGVESPVYKTGKKHKSKDWEIPEVRRGWIIVVVIFIAVAIFKDWYVQALIRIATGWFFGIYRKAYIEAYTTYEHDDDTEILKKKYEIIYGIKSNKEGNTNE